MKLLSVQNEEVIDHAAEAAYHKSEMAKIDAMKKTRKNATILKNARNYHQINYNYHSEKAKSK